VRLSPRQQAILTGILADIERLECLPLPTGYGTHGERQAILDAQHGIVRSDPARWLLKGLTSSDYVMLSRDYKHLIKLGLIQTHNFGMDQRRQTHLSLTDTGRDLAERLRMEVTTNG
jgi:hypothetical protein